MAVHILTVNGVERPLKLGTLNFQSVINGRRVFNCNIVSEAGAYRPTIGHPVKFNEDGSDIFGGLVDVTDETGAGGEPLADIETEIACVEYGIYADWVHITETFPIGTTIAQIATAIVTNYLGPNYGVTLDAGQVTGSALTAELAPDNELLSAFLDRLGVITGYSWAINPDKAFRIEVPGVVAAPFDVIDGDGNNVGDIRVTRSKQKYYNRIIVKFGEDRIVTYTQPFTGNGVLATFPLDFAIQGVFPNISAGAAAYGVVDFSAGPTTESIGGLTAPSGFLWEYDPSGPSITRRSGAVGNGIAFSLRYDVQFPQVVRAEDAGEIAANGLRELRVSLPDVYSKPEAQEYADQLLAQSLATLTTVEYLTRRTGIDAGMSQTITCADRNVNGSFLVTEVTASSRTDNQDVWRVVKAVSSSTFRGSYREVYKAWLGNGSSQSAGGGPAASTGGGCGWDYWDKAIGLALIDHADGAVVARGSSGGPDVGVESIPAILRLTSKLANDGIAQLAIGHETDEPEDDFTIWQIHGSGAPAARDTTVFLEHEGSGGMGISEYGGQLTLTGLDVAIHPNSVQFGNYDGLLAHFWKHDARAHRRIRVTGTTYTIDNEASGGGGVYSAWIFDPTAACTVTLPSVSAFMGLPSTGYGRVLEIRNDSALYVVTLDGASSELIFRGSTGRLTFPLMPGASIKLIALDSTGAGWKVLAYDLPPMETLLTDAQIKAWPTTPVLCVPYPGAGWRPKLIGATLSINNTNGDYTNINATYAAIEIRSSATSGHMLAIPMWEDSAYGIAQVSEFLAGANGRKYNDFPIPFFYGVDEGGSSATHIGEYIRTNGGTAGSAETEGGIQIQMDNNGSGNLTGGHASNSALLAVTYGVEAIAA